MLEAAALKERLMYFIFMVDGAAKETFLFFKKKLFLMILTCQTVFISKGGILDNGAKKSKNGCIYKRSL